MYAHENGCACDEETAHPSTHRRKMRKWVGQKSLWKKMKKISLKHRRNVMGMSRVNGEDFLVKQSYYTM
jgi:hypothetical protein